jgi:protein TonB
MSRLSIYETRWIDLVFENRNKEYGAYQLRHDSVKSSLTALFMGLLFVASLGAIPIISSYFNPDVAPVITPTEWSEPLEITPVDLQEIEKPKKTVLPEVQSQATEAPITKEALRDPIIVKPSEANPDIATNKEVVNTTTEPSNGTAPIGANPTSGTGPEIITETPTKILDPNAIANTTALDKLPEFPGGMDQFYKYVGSNFEKPEIEATGVIKIYVYFVIEKDGSMTDIQVKRDPGYGLGKEAVRVLKSLRAKWTPGMINSKPVRTAYNLPISVQIQ